MGPSELAARQMQAARLSALAGLGGFGLAGGASQGALRSGSQNQGLGNSVTFGRPYIPKPKDLPIREELQHETDEWLKDVV